MKATIIGASGLIGSELLTLVLMDANFKEVFVVVRKSIGVKHEKLTEKIIHFEDQKSFLDAIPEKSVVFSCIGTTQKKVDGDKESYRKSKFDITVNAARYAKEKQATHFIYVSAIGADSKSSNFYLKLKGEIENAVERIDLPCVCILRPSLLLGKRKEKRFGEQLAQWFLPLFSWILPYSYKPIAAERVAIKMIELSKSTSLGNRLIEGKSLFNTEND